MARDVAVTAWVERATKAALEQLARADGRKLSHYVERLLVAHVEKKKRAIRATKIVRPSEP